ncbi:unnamed protein product [Spirodela intermedia]|uniref:tRNA pseudouridine(55) synthase n=1 Tax=Spirodela intermedia TaxID=51605 RepID=A0A7I8INX8_SPIIN|nr:unnamed protein product [Spirodela intermedia]CAA6659558.1 unnamed protein product [Spirodela intermedia]
MLSRAATRGPSFSFPSEPPPPPEFLRRSSAALASAVHSSPPPPPAFLGHPLPALLRAHFIPRSAPFPAVAPPQRRRAPRRLLPDSRFPRLHAREEELYFYDAMAFPWEKEKHYRMVYQLEKKYFPDQSLEKAFLESRPTPTAAAEAKEEEGGGGGGRRTRGLVFFDQRAAAAPADHPVSEKKVEEFFKCLKKVPSASGGGADSAGEPWLASKKKGLPPRWDGPSGPCSWWTNPKVSGWTSFTVCGKLRRLVKVQKVGHAGTLDPMATGLLIVCLGKATKVVDRYQAMFKGYSGVFRLGEATSTWMPLLHLWEIWQVPPMFSAIKVGGERMYEKARRGETVELSPRRISIFQFDIERSLADRQNLIFRVTCSKGTYIRSLCADFGKALGSCAHLTALRRDSIGQYSVDDAWDFQELQDQITKGYL